MSAHTCAAPVAWPVLVDYWTGDLSDDDTTQVEEQLFACGACSDAFGELATLSEGLRLWARKARLSGNLSRALIEKMTRDDLTIRRYHLEPGDTVHCTAGPDDDLVTVEFGADLSGASRVDVVFREWEGGHARETRFEDVGIEGGRLVSWVEPGDQLRALPAGVMDVVLIAVEPAGDRIVGTYQLRHTPWTQGRR